MILEISVAVIALAFVILVVFVIIVLNGLRETLTTVHSELKILSKETESAVRNANVLAEDVQGKMKCLDPIFQSISNVGEIAEGKTCAWKNASYQKQHQFREALDENLNEQGPNEKIVDVIQWALEGVNLWQKLKKRS